MSKHFEKCEELQSKGCFMSNQAQILTTPLFCCIDI